MNTSPSSSQVATSLSSELTDREVQLGADYDWCLRDPVVQATYSGQVVAVHRQKVWGAGKTHGEAIEAALAQSNCPPREALAKVVIEGVVLEEIVS